MLFRDGLNDETTVHGNIINSFTTSSAINFCVLSISFYLSSLCFFLFSIHLFQSNTLPITSCTRKPIILYVCIHIQMPRSEALSMITGQLSEHHMLQLCRVCLVFGCAKRGWSLLHALYIILPYLIDCIPQRYILPWLPVAPSEFVAMVTSLAQ